MSLDTFEKHTIYKMSCYLEFWQNISTIYMYTRPIVFESALALYGAHGMRHSKKACIISEVGHFNPQCVNGHKTCIQYLNIHVLLYLICVKVWIILCSMMKIKLDVTSRSSKNIYISIWTKSWYSLILCYKVYIENSSKFVY